MTRRLIALAGFAPALLLSTAARAQTAPGTAAPPSDASGLPPSATASAINSNVTLDEERPNDQRPAQGFGQHGQLAISTDFQLSFGLRLQKEPSDQEQDIDYDTQSILRIAPTVDYFVANHLSIGANFLLGRDSVGDVTNNSLGGGLRLGYNIPLGDKLSFWPRGGGQVLQGKVSADDDEAGQVSTLRVRVVADAPLLFHPVPHFFIGAGPAFGIDLVSKVELGENAKNVNAVRQTDFAVTTVVGGWF